MWKQKQISDEKFDIVSARYQRFIEYVEDPNKEPIKVFNPLTSKHLQELELIREVSRQLQAKKEDDMRKAAQAKEEDNRAAENEKEKKAEEEAPVDEESKEE